MRVLVKLGPANAELLAELEATPPRNRAERLRCLAAVGLSLLRSRVASVVDPHMASAAVEQEDEETRRLTSGLFAHLTRDS